MSFFREQRIKQTTPKPLGGLIRCHDCGATGHIVVYPDGHILPDGWVMAWNRLKPLYTCKKCGSERVKRIKRLLDLK